MNRTIIHADFSIECDIEAPIGRVFNAFASKGIKASWFRWRGGAGEARVFDFRIGGSEEHFWNEDGSRRTFNARYYDIVENERIVYTYEMYIDDVRASVSLATVQFAKHGEETRLVLHEHGIFLDGQDTAPSREAQLRALIEKLAASIAK